jgi:hypothetical protein
MNPSKPHLSKPTEIRGIPVKATFVLLSVALAGVLCMAPTRQARAEQVLYQATGFITGAQAFTDSFDIPTAGTLTITLTDPPNWLDTIKDLNCFVSTTTSILGSKINGASDTVNVGPGTVYAHWSGNAVGDYPFGAYGISIAFTPAVPVPLPGTVGLLLCGLALLLFLRGTRQAGQIRA